MPVEESTSGFNFSYDRLIEIGEEKLGFMRRDAAEFGNYGVDAAKMDAFETQIEKFADLPTDDELEGEQLEKAEERDATRRALEDYLRDEIYSRARARYGEQSAKYRRFGRNKDLSRMSDSQLESAARKAIRTCTELKDELAGRGLTDAIIEELATTYGKFDKAEAAHDTSISDRDIATESRARAANALYAILVSYCDTGKAIWQSKSEAKYNDYVIYNTPSGTPEEEETPA